jgi:hypothetical protein
MRLVLTYRSPRLSVMLLRVWAYQHQPNGATWNMKTENLNEFWIEDHGSVNSERCKLQDNSTRSDDESVAVYFRDLEKHLIRHIQEAPMIVGCVAWLTSESILKALGQVDKGVAIVVQKEDFLRPDLGTGGDWKRRLRRLYDGMKLIEKGRWDWGGRLIGNLSVASWSEIQPLRCVGNHNRDKRPAFPRMHNKFLVFCRPHNYTPDEIKERGWGSFDPKPYAVWTGSFNFTRNAGMSLENALFLTDPKLVRAYYDEWEQIVAISEPLDWEKDWAEPEWRIGT